MTCLRFLISLPLWLLAILCCGCNGGTPAARQPTPEEARVGESCRIDSAALWQTIDADSLERCHGIDALSAQAWMLVDDATGTLISQRNAYRRMFPASLTKMMTCLLALEHGRMTDSIVVGKDVFVTRDSRLRPGDGYTEANLIAEMMLQSDNVAAYALAKHIGGDTLSFVAMMNRKAQYLGMDSTRFANPNGMPNDSNYSSARDLLVLSRYCMRDSAFARLAGTEFLDIPLLDRRHLPCHSTNLLLTRYDGCIGVKTGYTRQAGDCLAAAATRQGRTLQLVLLKSRSHDSRFDEAAKLLDYGFEMMGHGSR